MNKDPAKTQRDVIAKELTKRGQEIRKERAGKYKDPEDGHKQLGQIWGALISAEFGIDLPALPPRLVMVMFVAQKVHRSCMDAHVDHYVDAEVYNQLALEQAILDAIREMDVDKFLNKEKN